MTQAVPEVKNPSQTQPETIETNGNDVPSAGHNENISNEAAIAETVADVEAETGAVNGATQELETDPNIIKTEPFAPKPEIHPEVAEAGVIAIDPHTESEEMNKVAQTLGGQVVGHETPTQNLGQTVGEFNPPQEVDHTSTRVFPPVLETNKYADKKNNGAPLQALWKKRLESLLYGIKPKILGGTKTAPEATSAQDNISQLPQPREIKKAA